MIRVAIKVGEAHQDLLNHLLELNPRARAARLRLLATVGLLAMRGGISETLNAPVAIATDSRSAEPVPTEPTEPSSQISTQDVEAERMNMTSVRALANLIDPEE